ncbi:isoleucyl-tRNA synthetase [Streptococcus penaeicida]|uniref:Isoleucyl-tRNA synthetase n=1 Tax=Streptococcus penaeicida TaxID=1765960 RepID=A0A2N8LCD3_9STRE|nr:hypothetical protein [Streptococcus penaeicida]PND47817.1 isoleucyl-tRNA synthetase [Streptococcus penaeicida]
MNPQELFDQVKELIANKDLAGAKDFIETNKDDLGTYFEEAKGLLDGSEGLSGVLDQVKGLFGK